MLGALRKAVIPAAGLGTRFLPVTRAVPKPLLPVLDKPLIQYAVEEAAAAGIREIALVVSPGMEAIAEYFAPQPALERALAEKGDDARLAQQQAINELAEVRALVQAEPRGLGHAVLMAREFVGDETFAVFLPDDIIWSGRPAIRQLMDVAERYGGSVLAGKRVPMDLVPNLGIIDGEEVDQRVYRVRALVEKPPVEEAPSDLAIIGRYVLSPSVFEHIERGEAGALGEIQLTDAIAALISDEPVHACAFEGHHIDAGTPPGLFQAALYEAARRPGFSGLVQSEPPADG
ncbi:MAG: UTP--glucose-1-phosphate uridylyltransferase [Dehalococcoidia bacterium]